MLKLFNSYTRELEEFKPLNDKTVTMYTCGPTVYDYVHIGNFRSFLFADILRRTLEHNGYAVNQVMNLTDVGHMLHDAEVGEDKIETAAAKAGTTPQEITKKYSDYFFEAIKKFNIEPATEYPKASDNIPQMQAIIKKLVENDFAYVVDGDVYFNVRKFEKYGQLSGNTLDKLEAGARVEVNDKKKDPLDFASWISNDNHVMNWPSPWSEKGYPGWHIECSAMATRYLGETIDIHTGGEDNKFPHHECEIAQSESASGKQFARYWMHASFMLVDGKKMSKSLNNFYKIEDLEARGYSAEDIRYSLISTHYREQQNFTFESLASAKKARGRMNELYSRLSHSDGKERLEDQEARLVVEKAKNDFSDAINDDLNTPKALAVVFDLIRWINVYLDGGKQPIVAFKTFFEDTVVKVLGIRLLTLVAAGEDPELHKLIKEREEVKKNKEYKRADEIRNIAKEKFGVELKDMPDGTTLVIYLDRK